MLSAACPQCGRPAPVSLASPTVLRCPACRYQGPMPQGTAQNLVAAAHILHASNVAERQLTAAQHRALGAASSQNLIYFLVLGVSALPTFCFALAQLSMDIEEDAEDWIQASVLLITPFFAVMGVGLFIFYRLVKRRREMQDACAASPPAAQGEPCACHVCGAPLTAGRTAVVRCGHCAADNVVAADVVARANRQRQHVAADYAEHLRREIAAVSAVANRATILSFASAVLLPPATVVVLVLIVFPLILITRPADESVAYTHQVRPSGDCVAKVTRKRAGGAKLTYSSAGEGEEGFVDVPSLDGLPILHAKDFVGREVFDPKDPSIPRAKVASAHSDVITGNHLDLQVWKDGAFETKPSEHPTPQDCCFYDPSRAARPGAASAAASGTSPSPSPSPEAGADAGGSSRPLGHGRRGGAGR